MSWLTELGARLSRTASDPTSDLTGTAFLLAAIVVIILIAIMLILVWVSAPLPEDVKSTGSSPAGSPWAVRPAHKRRRRLLGIPGLLVAAAVMVALLAAGGIFATYADDSSTCMHCHSVSSGLTTAWTQDAHASVSCFACHAEPGTLGWATGLSRYVRWVSGDNPDDPQRSAFVPDGACLDCHGSVRSGTTQGTNLQVRHEDYLENYDCIECHADVGHAGFIAPAVGTMSRCLLCHDDELAPAGCATCHLEDVSRVSGTPPGRFPKVDMGSPEDCEGCHSLESCDACHGLRMPHTQDFIEWEHGREAAWGNTATCKKCHSYEKFCNGCHDFPGHAPGWKTAHGAVARSGKAGCLGCHSKGDHDFCAICHEE